MRVLLPTAFSNNIIAHTMLAFPRENFVGLGGGIGVFELFFWGGGENSPPLFFILMVFFLFVETDLIFVYSWNSTKESRHKIYPIIL